MVFLKSAFLFVLVVLLSGVSAEWRWAGKVAVVTGASSGIGEVIALTLADKGVIVVALARRIEKLKALSTKTNGTIHALESDLVKDEDILRVFRDIEEKLGGVDILINNAGKLRIGKLTVLPHIKIFYLGLYPASKFAVTVLTQSLAYELADAKSNIKVSSLSPGAVDTVRKGILPERTRPAFAQVDSQDIADGVVYILSTRTNVQIPELTFEPIGQRFW